MSNAERKSKIPDVPALTPLPGNLLSSVAPPSQLPNFAISTSAIPPEMLPPGIAGAPQAQPLPMVPEPTSTVSHIVPTVPQPVPAVPQTVPIKPTLLHREVLPQSEESFSPAIPLSKAEPFPCVRSPEDSLTLSLPASTPEVDIIECQPDTETDNYGDIMPGSGLITWVKGAVSSGGILHRVAEKAKSSVDSMITTLDPQMKEYLKSGGDIYIVVASDKEVKVSPIREAFQAVFGKATVVGVSAQSDGIALQPVGYGAAYAACKQRIAHVRSTRGEVNNNVPVIAVEGCLMEAATDRWYETSILVLSQPSLGIELEQLSQCTHVPSAAVAAIHAATAPDYPLLLTGYNVTVGSIMAASLQVPHTQWQEAVTGVSRKEILLLASRALAGAYKRLLAVSAAES